MKGVGMRPDLFGAVAAAAAGVSRVLRRDSMSAVLFWGHPPEVEVVHHSGMPDDVCRALTTAGGRHIAEAVRRSGRPLRVETREMSDEGRELRTALRAHGVPALAAFPLFGEMGVVGCLVVPLGSDSPEPPADDDTWRVACHACEGLQLIAGAAALKAAMAEDRRYPGELYAGLLVVDRWERIIFANGLFREIPGWNREDSFGRPLNALPGGALVASVRLGRPGALAWQEHVLPPIEGHGVPVAMAALPFGDETGDESGGRMIFLRDLRPGSDEQGTARLLALGMRVAHAADDLGRALDLVDRAHPTLERALLDRFLAEARAAEELVGAVLDRCMRSERRGAVDLNEMMHELLHRYRDDLEAQRIRVFAFLRPELPAVPGDPLDILRALRILLAVARRSLRPTGGSLTVRTWSEDGWVYGAVSDDGAGAASPSPGPHFAPLFDEGDEPTGDVAGLDQVRGIVGALGGRLNVESRPRVWTRHTIMLPVERRHGHAGSGAAPEVAVRSDGSGGLEVLVVDDNAALRSVLRRFLERRGHTVTEAEDGDAALRLVGTREFDRVIVDVQMPGKDGPEFFSCLEGVAPMLQQRTIFMTGGFLEEGTERFIHDSGRPAIRKPFDLSQMARTVEG